jgi:hypothetical protein
VDYIDSIQLVTFSPSSSNTSCVDVVLQDDSAVEENEVFFLVLSTNDSSVFFPNSTAPVEIVDDDGKVLPIGASWCLCMDGD